MASYLLKWENPEALEKWAMSGAIFESYVFSEIYKSYLSAGKEPPIFYYRDKNQREIDLLLYQNGVLSSVEIKKVASLGRTAVKNFHVLDQIPATDAEAFSGLETFSGMETLKKVHYNTPGKRQNSCHCCKRIRARSRKLLRQFKV